MEDTIRRAAKVLGAHGLEAVGRDSRFSVDGPDGSQLRVSIEAPQQRLIAELRDAKGSPRVDLDIAPLKKVTEDPAHPGRVTLHVGAMLIHLDSKPTLSVEVVTASP